MSSTTLRRMPAPSSWNTPLVSPLPSISKVFVIVQRDVHDVDVDPPVALDVLDGVGEDREVRQAEEVHLEQADLRDVLLGHLRDELALASLLDRHVVGKRIVGDQHARRVDADVAVKPLEAARGIDQRS